MQVRGHSDAILGAFGLRAPPAAPGIISTSPSSRSARTARLLRSRAQSFNGATVLALNRADRDTVPVTCPSAAALAITVTMMPAGWAVTLHIRRVHTAGPRRGKVERCQHRPRSGAYEELAILCRPLTPATGSLRDGSTNRRAGGTPCRLSPAADTLW
jgi:hypothetical protein